MKPSGLRHRYKAPLLLVGSVATFSFSGSAYAQRATPELIEAVREAEARLQKMQSLHKRAEVAVAETMIIEPQMAASTLRFAQERRRLSVVLPEFAQPQTDDASVFVKALREFRKSALLEVGASAGLAADKGKILACAYQRDVEESAYRVRTHPEYLLLTPADQRKLALLLEQALEDGPNPCLEPPDDPSDTIITDTAK
jgi:hypothetical protein